MSMSKSIEVRPAQPLRAVASLGTTTAFGARAAVRLARRLRDDRRGLTTVEYVIVLCLIAVVAVGTWKSFGDAIVRYIGGATTTIETNMPDAVKAGQGDPSTGG
jgi:Flp pilus assembly pilin Flp